MPSYLDHAQLPGKTETNPGVQQLKTIQDAALEKASEKSIYIRVQSG